MFSDHFNHKTVQVKVTMLAEVKSFWFFVSFIKKNALLSKAPHDRAPRSYSPIMSIYLY